MSENTWYLRTQDETFGPETQEKLVEWAQMGRIQPGQEISDDNLVWRRVEDVPFLDMRFSIDIGDGNPRGPFNRRAAEQLLASGRLPSVARMVEVREPFPEEAPESADAAPPVVRQEGLPGFEVPAGAASPVEPATSEEAVRCVAEENGPSEGSRPGDGDGAEPRQEAPAAEKIVEKVVEVPVEKAVEKAVADETREKELEALLDEARRRTDELQVRLDAAKKDIEAQAEKFQQEREAAAQEASAQLEAARQKAELAAQDADAHLAALQRECAARVAEAERKAESARKDADAHLAALQSECAARVAEAERKAESARKDADARVDEARQKLEAEEKESAARLAELREKSEAAVRDAQSEAETVRKDADARETKSREQIVSLENELRRLPQAASEVADIQAAVYSIMTKEAAELAELIEAEKRESDEFRRRQQERADRLLERRRELLKRAGSNIEDMTRKALVERPEDPRMAQLRREYEEFRREDEKKSRAYEDRILAASRQIEELRREISRRNVAEKDATQLQGEVVALREQLQRCEKDLLSERQISEELRQRQATSQQVLMARLASLESPTIAPANAAHAPETRQAREAHAVRLPRWMQLGGKR